MTSSSPGAATTVDGPGRHPFRDLYGALWRQAEGVRGTLLSAMGLLVGSQLLRLSIPWLAGQAINALQAQNFGISGRWITALALVYVLAWCLHGPGRILERNVALRVREGLADQLYARIAAAPLAWHEGHHSGQMQHRVHQASRALSDFAQNQFVYLQSVVNLVGPLVALMLLSRLSGALAVVGYVVIAFVIVNFDRALMKLAWRENDADRRYVSALLDFLSNAQTVIGLRLSAASRKLLAGRMAAISVPLKRTVVLNEGKWCAVDLMGLALTWGLVVVYVWQSREPGQAVMLGSVFMIYQYAQQAAGVVGSMAMNFQSFARMHTDLGSAGPIWDAPARDLPPEDERIDAAADWRRLDAKDLVLRYKPRGGGPAAADVASPPPSGLQGMTLSLCRGQRVALVGPSGGGKSTLLRVLAGLYRPDEGQLLFDGHARPWSSLREVATLIPQETEVFEASVRENLDFGQGEADEALWAAMRCSTFDDVIAGIGGSLETPLAERGSNLSGGQRQRLGLARGVLAARGSSLLLLDEPTSALDALTEQRVLHNIAQAFPDACVVASVHRLSLIAQFDAILLVEAGKLVDSGPRDEVLARRPALAAMVRGGPPTPSR
ncbi:ABC transporter ATP-binding protein [Variovorax dokdonensis]|uniref:ABC transporter ATP-binding protein n=1 Tax=Variovorax dokdonensis TaxID=344883 RepID=A0ABT7N7C7_9BURK|nr:ABC transporter ATP-binding protein [Variovorax dokdonensis]MDM0043790.1 ABC transporter ATP-binding protein [Variovorax dokdonensis]